jgi:hypothetical protein
MMRRIRPLSPKELQHLSVNCLRAYRSKALSIENTLADSDNTDIASTLDMSFIWFKDDPRWQILYDDVLAELARKKI